MADDDDTTDPSYWLNWRFFLCALWIVIALILASILIIKYEVFNKKKTNRKHDERDVDPIGLLYEGETWRTYLKSIHPAWLLVYRLFAFGVMLTLLITNLIIDGPDMLFFYTQWTFALVTFYFGLASSHSIYGCYQYWNGSDDDNINIDHERGTYMAPSEGLNSQSMPINPPNLVLVHGRKTAGAWGYFFQIIFQICAGAVGLTDSVFWFIIYPFLTPAEYTLNFLDVTMHSVNAVLLLVDIALNRLVSCTPSQSSYILCYPVVYCAWTFFYIKFYPTNLTNLTLLYQRFPFFRLAYFGLWTCAFVIFQWIVHACVSMWWPYSFLDLSSPYAPIWYLGVGLIHLPAFGIFALIVRGKQLLLSRFHDAHVA